MENNYVYLITLNDEMEARIIESKLKFYGIPVLMKHKGEGAFLSILLGSSNMPIDIYVEDNRVEEAKEILKSE